MKALFIFLMLNLPLMAQNSAFDKLYDLYSSKKFFKFISQFKETENSLNKNEKDICNVFYYALKNKPTESEKYFLPELIANKEIHDSVKKDLYSTSVINNVWLGNYKKSAEYSEILLKNYAAYIKQKDREDYENSLIIWKALGNLGKQEAVKKSETNIKMKKDIAGLYNLPVVYNNDSIDFVFDTGANFSTITESYASKLDLVITEAKIKVGTITEKKVDASIAYSKSFFMGNMEIKNTVFLVVPDSILSFAGGAYKINGILGFPVMEAMGEMILTRDGNFNVPLDVPESDLNNLVLDSFNPVIEVDYKNNPMAFTFDTGAKSTLLYSPFLNDYEKEVTSQYKLEDIKFSGAGGETKVSGYIIKDTELSVGKSKTSIPKLDLLSVPVRDKEEFFYGNLGQDFISKFDKMVLNFKYMSIDFQSPNP
ncbi:MAG: aspartyl protease family protein [Bacteroidetes bacterium]|nr:aspartyl protease family protein [Bacteroidota bacterium]